MNNKKKSTIALLFKLLKDGKIPWFPFIILFIVNMYATKLGIKMYEYAGEIMNGEIFDRTLTNKYLFASLVVAFIGTLTIVNSWLCVQFQKRTQQRIWNVFLRLPLSKIDDLGPSSLTSRVTTDAGFVGSFMTFAANIIQTGYALYLATGVLFKNSKELAKWVVPIIIVSTIVTMIFGRYSYKIYKKLQDVESVITKFFNEKISAIKLIKGFGTEEVEYKNGIIYSDLKFKAQNNRVLYDTLWSGYQSFITMVVKGVVLIMGAKLINEGKLEVGSFVTFFMLSGSFPGQVQSFFYNGLNLVRITGQTKVVASINDETLEELSSEKTSTDVIGSSNIQFQDVSFSYHNKEILKHLNFDIVNGNSMAIVGPSGAGKTTILKLIKRFYEPSEGELLLNNESSKNYHLGEWRSNIGYVIQDAPLLPGSIKDNILYGSKVEIQDSDIEEVLKLVNLYDEIMELEHGVDTYVGDIGDRLSAGQKQRIAIARAMISNPEVLIMDEATASLDTVNESEVMKNILERRQGKTTVIVAHKINTIKSVDNIIVMKNGEIVDTGNHKELAGRCNLYARLLG